MSVLCLCLLLFSGLDVSSGEDRRADTNCTVYGALGGSVLLQLNDSAWSQCPGTCNLEWKKHGSIRLAKLSNTTINTCFGNITNCQMFANGSLELSKITTNETGSYTIEIFSGGTFKSRHHFLLEVQDAVSVPEVNHTCHPNASVQLSCRVKNGTDPSYSWSMGGTPTWSPTGEKLTGYQSVLRDVACTVRNQVSKETSRPTNITCPDPVSVPEVNHTCLSNSSVQLSCRVKNGTDPSYSWSMDGTPTWSPTGEKLTGYQSVLRNVTCTVRNQVSEETSRPTNITCPDPVSVPEVGYTCLSNSSVQLSCRVKNGTDLSYSWSMYGTPTWSPTGEILTRYQSVLRSVTCTVRNQVSKEMSRPTDITCPDPVSEPVVSYTCLPNGSIPLSCRVENGTDPSYSWSVNGTLENSSSSSGEITIQQTVPLIVICTARNNISERPSDPTNVICSETLTIITTEVMTSTGSPAANSTGNSTSPGNTSDDCQHRCLLRAVTFGTVLLIVTILPLIIGCLYTMPREKHQREMPPLTD